MARAAKTKRPAFRLAPTQSIALVFALIILVGSVLLSLPIASQNGISCGFQPAMFTATSATCVTGLVLFDTWSQWSAFGQVVILCMIEIGGLGFMAMASLVVFALKRKVGLRQRMLMAQAWSVEDMEGVVKLQKWVVFGSLSVQFVGALILFLRFLPNYGFSKAVWWGIFHAVSAFCNAGFDVTGSIAPGANMIVFNQDPVVCLTLMALIVVGGLGFFVWQEVITLHSFRKFSVYTKLVLLASAFLLVFGGVLFCVLEWDNPGTIGWMDTPHKILNGFFQSVTVRTAGFTSVDQAALTDGSKALSVVLMLVGGASGSTAGGMKVVTFLVLVLFLISRARGRNRVTVFKRNVPQEKIMDAATIAGLMIGLAFLGAIVIVATSPVGFVDALFETVSALATVGLTAGATTSLSLVAQWMIILFMYFGRVGILTLSLGFLMGDKAENRFCYADTNLLIG
ncbi:MAG: potassium uptake protein, TrkH family [Oscillospiraceae bacterium]|nr:potassium uptake protein, TrkH family [Oscillospiraceae bacterium]